MVRLTVLLLAFTSITSPGPADWPQFRGPDASGLGIGSAPTRWNGATGEGIAWKAPIPGLGHSSPVVWGDRIFLTSALAESGSPHLKVGLYGDIQPVENEGAQRFNVYCLDRRSGKILWQATAAAGVAKVKRHPKSTHANPSPATDGKHLAVLFGSEGLYVYDLNGKLLWKKDLGVLDSGFFQVPAAQWGFASSPVIRNGRLLVQADVQKNSFLAAFEVATGREIWRTARSDVPTWSTPAVVPASSGGLQVVVNGFRHIGGYDFNTGGELWRLRGGGDIPVPTPVHSGDLVVITNAHGGLRPIYAIKTGARGDITGNREFIAWSEDRAGNYMQTPLLHDGLAYFCADNGVLSVYELASGRRLYQQRLGAGAAGFSSSPVAAAGRLYVTCEEGRTYVLALGPGYKLLAENELGETVMATPAISAGMLFLRGRSHLYAIGPAR